MSRQIDPHRMNPPSEPPADPSEIWIEDWERHCDEEGLSYDDDSFGEWVEEQEQLAAEARAERLIEQHEWEATHGY